jgi:hypothetical protein
MRRPCFFGHLRSPPHFAQLSTAPAALPAGPERTQCDIQRRATSLHVDIQGLSGTHRQRGPCRPRCGAPSCQAVVHTHNQVVWLFVRLHPLPVCALVSPGTKGQLYLRCKPLILVSSVRHHQHPVACARLTARGWLALLCKKRGCAALHPVYADRPSLTAV